MNMLRAAICSLAILKVNWDEEKKDYIENFVPLVAECIRISKEDVISISELQKEMLSLFGKDIPQNVVKSIVIRLKNRGYINQINRVYSPNRERLETLNFNHIQSKVITSYEKFVNGLIDYCKEQHQLEWSFEEAEKHLIAFLRNEGINIISKKYLGSSFFETKKFTTKSGYILGEYVQYIKSNDAENCIFLDTIAKGNMLANAVYFSDYKINKKNFKNTIIYFDTPFLIFALGYAGDERRNPCTELLNLCYRSGADLGCFRHTVSEIRGILSACASKLRNGCFSDGYGETVEYFIQKKLTGSDIEIFSQRIEEDLLSLRIKVIDSPSFELNYSIDENKFEEELKKNINYRNQQALQRDINSISSIVQLRKGNEYDHLENCKALFITTNVALAYTVINFFRTDYPNSFPFCLSDYEFTTLIWLKDPQKAPDLPLKRIIADSYASMQPSEKLWEKYIQEIDRIEQLGVFNPDDIFLLRYSLEAKSALMFKTYGDEDSVSNVTVAEILDIIRDKIKGDLKSEIEKERNLRNQAETRSDGFIQKEINRVKKLETRAFKISNRVVIILKGISTLLLIIGFSYSFPWHLPTFDNFLFSYALSIIFLLLLVISVLNIRFGTTLESMFRKLELYLCDKILSYLISIAE
jgi:hypothetical protein